MTFKQKNAIRQQIKRERPEEYADGRQARKVWSYRGAFGELPKTWQYNECVRGTTGLPRERKRQEEEDEAA